jgi:outer membrane protein assembly factor BamB
MSIATRRASACAVFFVFAFGCKCGSDHINAPEGKATPSPVNFGDETVGGNKNLGNQLILTNGAGGSLAITGSSLKGTNSKDFALTSVLPTSVLPGGTVSASLRFSPSAAGPRSAILEINTDSSATPTVDVPLSGVGVQIQVCAQPSPVDFGNVQVKGAPVTQTVTLTNCGGSPADLQFASPAIEGPNASDYTVSGQTNGTMSPGATMMLTVVFAPTTVGASTADIPFQVCSGCSPQSVNITGVGTDGSLIFAPKPVGFGFVNNGVIVNTMVTATNTGNEDITITTLGIQNGSAAFRIDSVSQAPPFQVAAGANFTMTVSFAPYPNSTNMDNLAATWTVADPTVAARTSIDPLVGDATLTPCTLQIIPTAVYFGSVNAGITVTKNLTLKNQGDAVCNVSAIALAASSDPGFALATPGVTSFAVGPGLTATIGINYSVATIASPYLRHGTLTFQTGDAANPSATVPLNAYLNNTVYSTGWPKWHFDNRNSGQSEANTAWLKGTVGWKFSVGSPSGNTYINSPVVDTAGNVYQLGMDGTFYAVSPTGSKLWSISVSSPSGDPHPSTPAILANGNMYLATGSDLGPNTGDSSLYFISPTGSILFQQPFGEDGFDACPGLGNDGTLYEADDDGPAVTGGSGDPYSALAFQVNGTKVTQIAGISLPLTNESERFGIAIADDGTSYWGNNGQYFALTPPSATPSFQPVSGWPSGGVTIAGGGLFASTVVSDLAVDGRVNNFIFAYSAWEGFSLTGFSTTIQGVLVALDPTNGSTAWTLQLPATTLSVAASGGAGAGNAAPAVGDDGTVYVGNGDGLRAVNGANGKVNWLFKCANVTSAPAIGGDGTIFFGTADGNLYAVNPLDGSLRFKITTGGPVSASPAIAPDGTVYVTSDDGNLYAIK